MADESNKCNEMTPADDGTKVPLNAEQTEEAKFEANPNGDAKIDIGAAPAFTGLSKEELMKYADDPFWVKLRWSLFILFWLGWAAMLVMAIVIIVRAPGCDPPPERVFLEEGALYEVDTSNLPTDTDLLSQIDRLGVNSVYLPGLISEGDFSMSNYNADALIKSLVAADKYVSTDLPSRIPDNNPLYQNASLAGLVFNNGNLNYTHPNLTTLFVQNLLNIWIDRGVKGFLMQTISTTEQDQFRNILNEKIKGKDGAVAGNVIDVGNAQGRISTPSGFRDFLMDNKGNWSFYRFNPNYEVTSARAPYEVRLMNIAMFAFRGTPILEHFDRSKMTNNTARFINDLSEFRSRDGIKFGEVHFANTSDDVIAFTRVQKGTPAYAVALNFGDRDEIVDYTGTANLGDVGDVELYSKMDALNDDPENMLKVNLEDVQLNPFDGMIIQFVADFA